jgi:adenine phosphoribosyltransferase
MDLSRYIRDVPDFPVKGVIFKDITPLLANSEAFQETINLIISNYNSWYRISWVYTCCSYSL